jgi:hypothetical protein
MSIAENGLWLPQNRPLNRSHPEGAPEVVFVAVFCL